MENTNRLNILNRKNRGRVKRGEIWEKITEKKNEKTIKKEREESKEGQKSKTG